MSFAVFLSDLDCSFSPCLSREAAVTPGEKYENCADKYLERMLNSWEIKRTLEFSRFLPHSLRQTMKSKRPIINSNHDCDVAPDRSQWRHEIRAVTAAAGWKLSAVVPPIDFVRREIQAASACLLLLFIVDRLEIRFSFRLRSAVRYLKGYRILNWS